MGELRWQAYRFLIGAGTSDYVGRGLQYLLRLVVGMWKFGQFPVLIFDQP